MALNRDFSELCNALNGAVRRRAFEEAAVAALELSLSPSIQCDFALVCATQAVALAQLAALQGKDKP